MTRSIRARSALARPPLQPLARLCAALVVVIVAAGCETPERVDSESRLEPLRTSAPASVRPVRDLDSESLRHLSLLLAGALPAHERDGLEPVWRRHAEEMDALWSRLEPRLESMERWARAEAPSLASSPALVFVPFAEGDLASALRLFPEAASYLLVGSQAPGRLVLPEEMAPEETPRGILKRKLESLRARVAGAIGLSASPTPKSVRRHPDDDTPVPLSQRSQPLSGVLPVLLTTLVRDGRLPLEVEYVHIDPGSLHVAPLPETEPEARAVRVMFADLGASLLLEGDALVAALADAPRRTAYYVASDLADTALLPDAPLRRLLAAQPTFRVFLRSTDYSPHQASHSVFRELVLGHASAVVQDDSGLPLRSFTSDTWSVELFGGYRGEPTVLKRQFQADLAAAYERSDSAPLPFVLGARSATALIVARRLEEPSAAAR